MHEVGDGLGRMPHGIDREVDLCNFTLWIDLEGDVD
jgi:hypothetical protein